ncbi:MAG: NAD-dependent epimerase/dehydratase family protein [Vulcanimicrobiota bacterium]
MKNVLVTGGAGFVGSNLVRRLCGMGCHVTVLDDLFTGDRAFLHGLELDFVEGSVVDIPLLMRLAEGKDVIFHLACRNIIISRQMPRQDLEVNAVGTFNVLEAAQQKGVGRVVYTSTASVYGNPQYIPVLEHEQPKFLSFYSSSKYAGESYAHAFFEMFGVPMTIVRYSNVYGPNQSPKNPYCGVIGKFLTNALAGAPLSIHGDGEQTRDYTYVDDAVEATISAATHPKAVGEVYNIGTEVETSVNRLAELIVKATGSASEILYVDKRDIDNVRRRALSISKIRSHLRFSPQVSLKKGLELTLNHMREAAR